MGDFLSKPNMTKESEDNENDKVRYGSCGMQGWRKKMEDAHITDISLGDHKQFEVFGVFDGHGGKEVSQFVKAHFTQELLNNKHFNLGDYKTALIENFLKMDEMLKTDKGQNELKELAKKSKEEEELQTKNSKKKKENNQYDLLGSYLKEQENPDDNIALMTGCTACVCLIDQISKQMYFANSGDSRVVLYKNGVAFAMSMDHKPELNDEKNRIYKAGGWISEGRIKGNLNLSRGIGDLEYKQNEKLKPEEQMITAYPDIVIENLDENCEFILIGCDGIWDCMTNQEACDYVKDGLTKGGEGPFKVRLSSILESMMDKNCPDNIGEDEEIVGCDNMTGIIIQFKK